MNSRFICAMAAASLALSAFAAPAYAQTQETTQFRAVEARTFTAEDMQRYGLDESQTERAMDLQTQGYQIVALTPEEAEAYQAGAISQTEWILIGIGVLIILAVA